MSTLKHNLDEIQRKAKERTVRTQNIEYDLETLVKKIDKNIIKLNPDYQRRHRWDESTASKLIESLILNIPIPLIYISQDVDVDEEVDEDIARYSVIDGQQRLTAIQNFFKNEYALVDLDVLKELNGTFYKDLPSFLIRRLEERTIKCLRIDSTIDQQVKYDIFERLNSGSVKLEAQELRNATCRGPFKELIKKLSKNKIFTKLAQLDTTGKRVQKMEDQELVLRFFSLVYKDGYQSYKGGFKQFLTDKMNLFNSLDTSELIIMEKTFNDVITFIEQHYGDEPFAKYRVNEEGEYERMSKFNAAVYDAVVVSISKKLTDDPEMDITYDRFKEIFKDKDFFSSIEGSVNDVKKLQVRIEKALEVI